MRLWTVVSFIGTVALAGAAVIAADQSSGNRQGIREPRATPWQVGSIETPWQIEPRVTPAQGRLQATLSFGARLGVGLRELDAASSKEHKLPSMDGVLVESVERGSAAEKAGIHSGDVITEFDGERVRSIPHLRRLVSETATGRTVKVGVVRDGKKIELRATLDEPSHDRLLLFPGGRLTIDPGGALWDELWGTLGDRPLGDFLFRFDDREFRFPRSTPPAPQVQPRPRWPLYQWSPGAGRLGVVVQDLTPQLAEYFNVKDGVLVASVSQDSPASRAGLKAGDVVTTFNGKAVRSPDDLVRAVRDVPDGQEVSIDVVRDRKTLTLKVKLAGPKPGRPA